MLITVYVRVRSKGTRTVVERQKGFQRRNFPKMIPTSPVINAAMYKGIVLSCCGWAIEADLKLLALSIVASFCNIAICS